MTNNTEHVLSDLRRFAGELEGLTKAAASCAGDRASETVQEVQAGIDRARERVREIESELLHRSRKGIRQADRYVRENAWTSLATAAVLGFAVGAVLARRD